MTKNPKIFQNLLKTFFSFSLMLTLVFSLNSCFDQGKKETNSKSETEKEEKKNSNNAYSEFLVPGSPNVFAFFMEACPACRRTKPVFNQVLDRYADFNVKRFVFEKDQEVISNLRVTSFPTIIFFDEFGEEVKTIVGEADQAKLEEAFSQASGSIEEDHQNSIRTQTEE